MTVITINHNEGLCPFWINHPQSEIADAARRKRWEHLFVLVFTGFGPWRKYWWRCWSCDHREYIGRFDPKPWVIDYRSGTLDQSYYMPIYRHASLDPLYLLSACRNLFRRGGGLHSRSVDAHQGR